jgi:beta-lactamase superfamily II metal-dependent hydrolase
MQNEIQIRTVTVELMRPGPAHNQLLSPITQYLGVCDDAEAGVVTQPYEHAVFLERMKAMRYVDNGGDDADDGGRRSALRELGVEAGRVLGRIPSLAGALTTDAAGPETLVHLRLVLTPSELAALPFELAKAPSGPNSVTESWLSLQARSPVVITRRTRNVSALGVKWPMRPRVLFVSASPDDVPFEDHRNELLQALAPFCMPGRDEARLSADGRREQWGALLTILKDASFDEVLAECAAQPYTHVHVLAHGDVDSRSIYTSYGLRLHDEFIAADRLASALTGLNRNGMHRPAVVTLATCDSGDPGSVLVPGGSIAHVLHQAGIALVLASQVPLSKAGSVRVVRELYRGLLWGDNPWLLMHRLRTALHGLLGDQTHDWASLVVYEALPRDLEQQLEEAHYRQAKAANAVAFERIDLAVQKSGDYAAEMQAMHESLQRLPEAGRFALEGLGLRASSYKRLAEAEFRIAQQPGCAAAGPHVVSSVRYLQQALHHYESAVDGFLVNTGNEAQQRVATLHWVLVQQLCLSAVLNKLRPDGAAATAQMSAQAYLTHPDLAEQAWAHGSLAELCLLSLRTTACTPEAFAQARACALGHARELLRLAQRVEQSFIVTSTLKQFRRYVNWWGSAVMENVVLSMERQPRRSDGDAAFGQRGESTWQRLGVVALAVELAELLDDQLATDRSTQAAVLAGFEAPAPAHAPTQAPAPSPNPAPATVGMLAAPAPAKTAAPAHVGASHFHIEMLAAGHGDCLWVEYGSGSKTARTLVDCGTNSTFAKVLKTRIQQQQASERHFELFILTHIDDDHIGGGVPLLKEAKELGLSFDDVWFNGWKHISAFGMLNARKGEVFSELTDIGNFNWNCWTDGRAIVVPEDGKPITQTLPSGLVLSLLSPNADKLKTLAPKWKKEIEALGKKPGEKGFLAAAVPRGSNSTDVAALANTPFETDTAPNNGSSITVLAEYQGKAVLLGADAHAPLLVQSIKKLLKARGQSRLKLDAFKLPHHGSRNNLNQELLELLDCKQYLFSSDGSTFKHPDREAVARVIRFGGKQPRLLFNYDSAINRVWKDAALQHQYGYEAVYPPAGQKGLLVQL